MNDPKRIIIVLLGLIFVGICALGIKGHMDSEGYKNQVNYITAVQSTKADDFNYIVDSQQGRVLATGQFTTKDHLAKFPEMTKGFTYVARTRQHYTMHTYETCSGKPTVCTTHVYYSWDDRETDEKYANKVTLFGRNYNATLFNFGDFKQDADACSITPKNKNTGFFDSKHGCEESWLGGQYYYIDNDDRYFYEVVPTQLTATFLATTYGGLKPFNEDSITLQNKNIPQVLKDVGQYQLISFWVVTILIILLTIGAGFAAYAWVMEDGVWSLDE